MSKQASAAIHDHQINLEKNAAPVTGSLDFKNINVFESILASKGLPSIEKETERLAQEGFVVLVAGGETTARVLTTATYHLLANQDTALKRLKEELVAEMPNEDEEPGMKRLEQLPWLVNTHCSK